MVSSSGKMFMSLMKYTFVDQIVVVYNYHPKKHCWNYSELCKFLIGNYHHDPDIVVGEQLMLCDHDST